MSIASVKSTKKIKKNKKKEIISIEDIYNQIKLCNKCNLKKLLEVNKNIVKSSGRYNAPIMMIGKNPSYKRRGDICFGKEDNVNYPILDKMLRKYKFSMNDVYSTNLVKCSTKNNNDPDEKSCNLCVEYLKNEIKFIKPKIIICLGKYVSNYFKINFGERIEKNEIIIISIKHPSSLSYDNSKKKRIKYIKQLEIIKNDLNKIRNNMFVQFHFHDEYSVRDAIGKIEDYESFIKENKLPAFSVTNHGNIGGFIRQYLMCKNLKIKPVFGCELYVNNFRKEVQKELEKEKRKNNHLCVYAKNYEGFKNLVKITSDAWINGHYYKPRTDSKFLKNNSKGLIASSACLGGKLQELLANNKEEKAIRFLKKYKSIFDEFYIELIIIDMKEQEEMNSKLVKIAKETDTKTIITVDTHYMKKEYSKTHDIMLLIRDNHTLKDLEEGKKDIFQYSVKDLYYKNVNEIYETFKNGHMSEIFDESFFWKSIDNTFDLIDSIEDIKLDTSLKLPKMSEDSENELKIKIKKGFVFRNFDKIKNKEYYERMKYEYKIICDMGFADYFLIIADIICWAKDNGIYVGCGRGSAAGSLISYLLRITDLDPIKYGLLFERFLSIGRKDIPDVDTDFEPNYRDDVKKYIVERFGAENTCTIGTYGTYKSRGVLLDVARVYNIPLNETLQLTKNVMTTECDSMTFEEIKSEFPAVKKYFDKYSNILNHCNILRGQIRNISKHAAGVIISDRNLSNNIALMCLDKHIFSAWQEGSDFHELSSLGFVKFDILGLNNLSVIKDCVKLIKKRHKKDIDIYDIDMNNDNAFKLANYADTFGIFQFESRISRDLLKKVGVNSFMDLSHVSSLLRPGPLRAGVSDLFADRKNKKKKFKIPEILKDILKETYGVIIYQEQIMLIAQKIGGFTLPESNEFRKALVKYGKGDLVEAERYEKVASYKDKFINTAKQYLNEDDVKDMWKKMASFAQYGFNRCVVGSTILLRGNGNQFCGKEVSVESLYNTQFENTSYGSKIRNGFWPLIQSVAENNRVKLNRIVNIYKNGVKKVYEIKTKNKKRIKATINHRFLMSDNTYKQISEMKVGDEIFIYEDKFDKKIKAGNRSTAKGNYLGKAYYLKGKDNPAFIDGRSELFRTAKKEVYIRSNGFCEICRKRENDKFEYHHIEKLENLNFDYLKYHNKINMLFLCNNCHKKEDYKLNNRVKRWDKGKSLKIDKIISIKYTSEEMTYDIEMKDPYHNFIANGFVSHNSHSVSYAYISYVEFYLKANYFIEFVTSLLNNTDRGKETNQRDKFLKVYINYIREKKINVINPDINLSEEYFSIIDNKTIIYGLSHIKNMGTNYLKIIENRPYKNLEEFCSKNKNNKMYKNKVESLIYAGAFDKFGDRNDLIKKYNTEININKKYEHKNLNKMEIIQKETEVLNICLSSSIFTDALNDKIKKSQYDKPYKIVKFGMYDTSVIGMLSKITQHKTKSGKNVGSKYYRLTISDDIESIQLNVFNDKDIIYIDEQHIRENDFVAIKDIKIHEQSKMWNTTERLQNCVTILKNK